MTRLLSNFYQDVIHNNETKKSGWVCLYYGVFAKVINDHHYKRVAEVGIGYGCHAKSLLKDTNVEHLFLVDPTVWYPNDNFATDILQCTNDVCPGTDSFAGLRILMDRYLAEDSNPSRYTWLKVKSLDVTQEQIPDQSLDAVFIDADHSYDAVLADLKFWSKKVTHPGHILGDDYWISSVKQALNDFCTETKLSYELLSLPGSDYKIYSIRI